MEPFYKNAPVVQAGKKFGRYRSLNEEHFRKMRIDGSDGLIAIEHAWRSIKTTLVDVIPSKLNGTYPPMLEKLGRIKYDAKDVENFSLLLASYQDECEGEFWGKAGLFLTALAQVGGDEEFKVNVSHLDAPVRYLGYQNCKKLTIFGDTEDCAGIQMNRGLLVFNGNVGRVCGAEMRGGCIIINGNTGEQLGDGMMDGTIIVNGNAGEEVVKSMHGGVLHLNGDYGSLGIVYEGLVYHKGKLIEGR